MTLSDFEGHEPITGILKCNSRTTLQQLTICSHEALRYANSQTYTQTRL